MWNCKHSSYECKRTSNWKLSKLYKMFTNGSVLDSLLSGAGYVIPDLKVQKSFYLGKSFSIFTSIVICNINGIKLQVQYPVSNI